MKTKLILLTFLASAFVMQMQAQGSSRINAMNDEISDNLDLKAVASIFGDSNNLQDFERRLNDPELQISNLDLNNDDEVDYLRVIESVNNRTHLIIIQSVLDRDLYQDVATIDVEKDRYNNVHVQIIGDSYMYGQNYIYEPVYYHTPSIYASFWSFNYRPYYSTWSWNYYPSYYYAWNPFSVFTYRNNISLSLNVNNNYNYVNTRRSSQAAILYNSRRSNGYERQHPNYAFSRRNSNVVNRYELDQRRNPRNGGYRNEAGTRTRTESHRDYSQNRTNPTRDHSPRREESTRGNFPQRNESPRQNAPRQEAPQRNESPRQNAPRQDAPQRTESPRQNAPRQDAPQRNEYPRQNAPRQDAPQRNESPRQNAPRQDAPQRTESPRQNAPRQDAPQRTESPRQNAPRQDDAQRNESQRGNSHSRNSSSDENSSSSRGNNRRS